MSLPEPILDDLRFQQDLVDEARRRIIRYCPEWTDYNLSDPGITLIELFAWMTELTVYRLNRVPDKNYVKFMEMLGMALQPASSARVPLTFRLSTALPFGPEDDTYVTVPSGLQVSNIPTEDEPEVTFTTDTRLTVVPPKLTQLRRDQDFHKNYLPRLGIETFYPFQRTPQPGDTFFIGFDEARDISGHILRLAFENQQTQATGIKRDDPPLVWECTMGNGVWREIAPSMLPGERDTTGGLNNPSGTMMFYLPLEMKPDVVNGREGYWIRCRIEQRRPEQGMYTQSPRVLNLTASALGGTTMATHAVPVENEILGRSDGDPGQRFVAQNTPILELNDNEWVEVQEKTPDGDLVFVPWKRVKDFATSTRFDRHYVLTTSTGEVQFGPAVRQPDGSVRQYGRVPEAGRVIRFRQYRHGGGVMGNLAAGRIASMRSAVPYVSTVSNMDRASGGRDAESLDEAKLRARRAIHAQQRAVTADDFENLTLSASREVARVKCNTPMENSGLPAGSVELLVVPSAFDALRVGNRSRLTLEGGLATRLQRNLDQYRLLTTTVHVREPKYLGVKVEVEVVPTPYMQPDIVRSRVREALNAFLSPLNLYGDGKPPIEELDRWEGWPFGRDLFESEVFTLVQQVPGVKHVVQVALSTRPVDPGSELPPDEDSDADVLGEDEEAARRRVTPAVTPLRGRRVEVAEDTLLVSLDHEVKLVEL